MGSNILKILFGHVDYRIYSFEKNEKTGEKPSLIRFFIEKIKFVFFHRMMGFKNAYGLKNYFFYGTYHLICKFKYKRQNHIVSEKLRFRAASYKKQGYG